MVAHTAGNRDHMRVRSHANTGITNRFKTPRQHYRHDYVSDGPLATASHLLHPVDLYVANHLTLVSVDLKNMLLQTVRLLRETQQHLAPKQQFAVVGASQQDTYGLHGCRAGQFPCSVHKCIKTGCAGLEGGCG